MSQTTTQTIWIPLKFQYDKTSKIAHPIIPGNKDKKNQDENIKWHDTLGHELIASTSVSIGGENYEWEPLEGCGFTIKGPRPIEWRCRCGYHILDPLPGFDPPKTCPMCQYNHQK